MKGAKKEGAPKKAATKKTAAKKVGGGKSKGKKETKDPKGTKDVKEPQEEEKKDELIKLGGTVNALQNYSKPEAEYGKTIEEIIIQALTDETGNLDEDKHKAFLIAVNELHCDGWRIPPEYLDAEGLTKEIQKEGVPYERMKEIKAILKTNGALKLLKAGEEWGPEDELPAL